MSASSEDTDRAGLCKSRDVAGGLAGGITRVSIGECGCPGRQ